MNAYSGMKKTIAVMLAAVMAIAAMAVIVSADDANANTVPDTDKITDSGFVQDKSGTLNVPIWTNESLPITVTVTVYDGTVQKAIVKDYQITEVDQVVSLSFGLSVGTHNISIKVDDGVNTPVTTQHEITCKSSVWSNVMTYIAIVVIVIIVIVIAVVYMRANPRNKPTTTFTELEAEKEQAKAAEKTSAPEKKPTEKIKYTSSRRK